MTSWYGHIFVLLAICANKKNVIYQKFINQNLFEKHFDEGEDDDYDESHSKMHLWQRSCVESGHHLKLTDPWENGLKVKIKSTIFKLIIIIGGWGIFCDIAHR